MSFETVRYTPDQRAPLVSLLARVGTTQLSDEEFAWWFERNPAGEGIVSLAVDEGEVVGVAAMSFFRTALRGVETRLAIPVNVATDPRYRGQGVFSTLERENEAAAGAPDDPPGSLQGLEVRAVERFGPDLDELGRRAATGYGSHFVRDAEYFNWRYLDSPRDYRCFGAYRDGKLVGVAVVGHTFKHGVSAGFLADLVASPGGSQETRALLTRAVAEVRGE